MFKLDEAELLLVFDRLSAVEGKALNNMYRYVGFQAFEFGEEIPAFTSKNEPTTISEAGLAIGCYWEIQGPNQFLLGSQHFGADGERHDSFADPFYKLVVDKVLIPEELTVEPDGGLAIRFSHSYKLFVRSDESFEEPWQEQWRFMPLESDPRGHLVLEPKALVTCPIRN